MNNAYGFADMRKTRGIYILSLVIYTIALINFDLIILTYIGKKLSP